MPRRERTKPLMVNEVRGFGPRYSDVRSRVEKLPSGRRVLLPVLCHSKSMIYTTDMLKAVIKNKACSVLITGETGTGKEMLAQCMIEAEGVEKTRAHTLNCASLTNEQLAESELFGHLRGSFTGATKNRDGLVTVCEDGVLFLDEIGWLPKTVQAKLLRFMETGEFRKVGSNVTERAGNVRIIAATNSKKIVGKKAVLLHDLVHRFDHWIELPPLRERGADTLWLLGAKGFFGGQRTFTGISLRTLLGVLCQKWEGNIREVQKYCKRKITFRHLEILEPHEDAGVLDDEDLAREAKIYTIAGWATEVLSQMTKKHYEYAPACGDILLRLQDWRGRRAIDEDWEGDPDEWYNPGIVFPLKNWEDLMFTPFNKPIDFTVLMGIIGQPFDNPRLPAEAGEDELEARNCGDWATVITYLAEMVKRYPDKRAAMMRDLKAPYRRPEITWHKSIKTGEALDAYLKQEESEETDFEALLANSGLDQKTETICRLCKQGKTQREIEKEVGLSQGAISDKLKDVRRNHGELTRHLKGQKKGRKPRKP